MSRFSFFWMISCSQTDRFCFRAGRKTERISPFQCIPYRARELQQLRFVVGDT